MTKAMMIVCSLLVGGSAGLSASSGVGHCDKCVADGKKMIAQLDQGKATLAKAVTAAEQHSKGRAVSVISELNDTDELVLKVYCIVGDKIMKCTVEGSAAVVDMKEVSALPLAEHAGDHQQARADAQRVQTGAVLTNQIVEAGCGKCIFGMSGVKGCKLAVKIDGKPYLVTGANHINAHDYCSVSKKATVSGRIEGDKFIATKFEAQP